MSARDRLIFSLRAVIGGVISALILGTAVYLLLDLRNPAEMSKLAFWTGLCVLFVATLAFACAGVPYLLGVLIGGVFGFVFCFVALWPFGFWPGPFETPIIILWPLVGLGGFAYATSRVHARPTRRGSRAWALAGVAAAVLLVIGIKAGFARVAEPLDFARYKSNVPRPHIDKVLGTNVDSTLTPPCKGAPLPARLLSDAGIGIDSTVTIKPFGSYSDVRTSGAGKMFGYRVQLWVAGGVSHGYLEQYNGEPTPSRAMLEQITYPDESNVLKLQAHFADGYVAEFTGTYNVANLQGTFRIIDSSCDARVLSSEPVVLTQQSADSSQMFGAQEDKTLRDFGVSYANVFQRVPAPSFPEPPALEGSLFVADRFYYGAKTSAAAFSARFMTAADLQRYLDTTRTVGKHESRTLTLGDVLFARAIDTHSNLASWIVVGPSESVRAYVGELHTALAAKDGLEHMSYRMLPVEFVADN